MQHKYKSFINKIKHAHNNEELLVVEEEILLEPMLDPVETGILLQSIQIRLQIETMFLIQECSMMNNAIRRIADKIDPPVEG